MPPENLPETAVDFSLRQKPREFPWATIPYWFAAIAGLTYATGFLVEFTFQHSLGITVSLDVFKAKYIYIGLQCLQFPASIMLLLFGSLRAKRKEWDIDKERITAEKQLATIKASKQSSQGEVEQETVNDQTIKQLEAKVDELQKNELRVVFSFILGMCGLLLLFYLTTTFSRPSEWSQMQLPVALLSFGITILMGAIRGAEWIISFLISKFHSGQSERQTVRKGGRIARIILLLLELAAIAYFCWGPITLFWASFVDGGYFYVGFILLVFMMLGFLQGFMPVFARHRRTGALMAMNLSVTFSFLYLSTLAYAYHIYPYLPIGRGGGDYSADARACILTFAKDQISSIPEEILNGDSLQSHPLTLLDDAVDSIIFTLEYKQADREKWRLVGVENKPKVVYSLKKEAIVDITYQDVAKVPPPSPRPRPGNAPATPPATVPAPPSVQPTPTAVVSPTVPPAVAQSPKTTPSSLASATATPRRHKATKTRPRS